MTIEARTKINYGLRTETREIPPGEYVYLSHRELTGFRVVDPDTVKGGFRIDPRFGYVINTDVVKRDKINAQKLRQADHLSIKDRLLGRGHEVYRWRP